MDLSEDLSDASTPRRCSEAGSDSEADELSEFVACLHVGDPDDFAAHLGELLREFLHAGSGRASEGLSFCSLLLVAFMRVGAQNAGDDFLDADAREKWMECIRGAGRGSEEAVMKCFVGCLGSGDSCKNLLSRVLRRQDFDYWEKLHMVPRGSVGGDPLLVAVYAIDYFVRRFLEPKGINTKRWQADVGGGWYRGSEPAAAFFQRANDFLAAHVSEYTRALGEAVKIGSYCALLRTSRLAALLLFEHLAESKLQHKAGAAGPPSSFAGFRLLVGSSGGVVSAEPSALPSRAALAIALEGLRAVAGLPHTDLARLAGGGPGEAQATESIAGRKRKRTGEMDAAAMREAFQAEASSFKSWFDYAPFSVEEWTKERNGHAEDDEKERSELGKGSFAITYRMQILNEISGTDVKRGKWFAVKTILKRTIRDFNISEEVIHEEVRLLTEVSHENVIQCFHLFNEGRCFHLVMEIALGGTVADRIKRAQREPIEERQIESWMAELASAFKYMHERNIFHRDVKPENLLLSDGQQIKVVAAYPLARKLTSCYPEMIPLLYTVNVLESHLFG
jgi:hypothetical protein